MRRRLGRDRRMDCADQSQGALDVTCIQNSRNRSTRELGGLPAMMAALIAPIEMPAIQLGWISASASAS